MISNPHRTPSGTTTGRVVAVLAALSLLGACGGDDDDVADEVTADEETADEPTEEAVTTTAAPAPTEPPTSTSPTPTTEPAPTTAAPTTVPTTVPTPTTDESPATTDAMPAGTGPAACGTYFEINDAMSAVFAGFGDPSVIPDLLVALDADKPPEIEAELSTMIAGATAWSESGFEDFGALDSPEMSAAASAVDGWMFENCEFTTRAEVALVDYAFGGIEPTYPAGLTAFRLTNAGTESHEMAVVRRKDGATMSWDEIFSLPEEEIQEQIDFLGAGFAAAPGDTATLIVDLTPGEYLALCFVSKGSTPGVEGTGPPHVMEGMRAEFTVT